MSWLKRFWNWLKSLFSHKSKPVTPAETQNQSEHDLTLALKIIKEFEGGRLKAYLDVAGVPTIGWGTIKYPNGMRVKMGDVITQAEADEFLKFGVQEKTKGVNELVEIKLNNNEYSALISFTYNVGIGAFRNSTLLRKLNSGEAKIKVADEFLRWTHAGGHVVNGLVRRRKAERELFLAGSSVRAA